MTAFVDTHCHLSDPKFGHDIEAVIERATAAGVIRLVDCGYDAASNEAVLARAEAYPAVCAAVGFHPHEADDVSESMLRDIESAAATPSVLMFGEIGLDNYRHHSSPESQARLLDRQLEIALAAGKPVSLHSRAAEDAIYDHLAPYARAWSQPRPPGVMHCFGGTLDQARRYVDLGFLVSLACTVGYPAASVARDVAAGLPLASIVVETDSPYLPPQSMRGKRNEPAHVVEAARGVAAARASALEDVASATTANALALLGLDVTAGVSR